MRLLSRTAGSVLWLSPGSDAACARLRSEASTRGIDPARLVFAAPPADHLSLHRLADLFLDTLPFNAAAAEPEQLADCKRRLAGQRTAAPPFDLDRFRRHLEAAYARMYALSRSGTPPQSFAVTAE